MQAAAISRREIRLRANHEDNPNASIAAFSIAGRGAGSPVKISNCLAACSMNISRPGIISRPCSSARLQQAASGRVVDHVEHDIRGDLAIEKTPVLVRMHAERRRMHQRVEVGSIQISSAATASAPVARASAFTFSELRPVIDDLRARVRQRESRAARRAPIAGDQHSRFRQLHLSAERPVTP